MSTRGLSPSPPRLGATLAGGQTVAEPANDVGVIAKTAAFRVDGIETALLFLAMAIGGYAFLIDRNLTAMANVAVPVFLIVAMGWGCGRMAMQQVETILTPTFVMRLAILFFGGFGALVPLYSNNATREYIEGFFRFTDEELLKNNLVVVFYSVIFVFSGSIFKSIVINVSHALPRQRLRLNIQPSHLSLNVMAMMFLISGAFVKYVFIIPFQFGLSNGSFPVFLYQIAVFEYIGLFLGLFWALRYRSFFVPFFVFYGIFTSFVGVLTFSKIEVIFPVVMMAAAYIYAKPTLVRIGLSVLAILITFYTIQPIANHGRAWLNRSYATITVAADFSERIEIIRNYFDGNVVDDDSDVNLALVRFSYVNVGTFVIQARDNGWEGDTLKNVWALFIPRVLWPDKPVLTEIAVDLNIAISGNANSAVAPGLAAEGYWDGGWPGVALMALAVGMICYLWSLYSLEVQRVGAWHLFVIVLLGVRSGLRFDGFFVVDILGPLIYAVLGHFAITWLNWLLALRR